MLGSDHHKRGAKNRIGPGRKHFKHFGSAGFAGFAGAASYGLLVASRSAAEHPKPNPRALAAADPVALRFLDAVAPVQLLEAVEQALGKGTDAHGPLKHGLLHDGMAAALAQTVHDFVVGEHGSEGRTPVDQRLAAVGQAEVLQQRFALRRVHGGPFGRGALGFPVVGGVQAFGAPRAQVGHERFDRLRALALPVVPGVKQLKEYPLRPAVVVGVAGLHLAAPVKAQPEAVELLAVALDVGLGRDGGVLTGLNGVLLRRKPKGVKAHRVQHIKALVPLKTTDDVAGDVAQRVPHVEPRTRGVGEHVEHIKGLPIRRKIRAVHV